MIPNIKVLGYILNLEYEGLHIKCFVCGKYRHKLSIYLETVNNETLVEVPHGSMKVVLNGEDG